MKRLSKKTAANYLQNPVVAEKLSVDTRNAVNNKKVTLKSVVAYVRKAVTIGGGSVQLVDTKTDKTVGVSNFDGNRLAPYRNIIFDRISLGYAQDAEAGKEAEVLYDSSLPEGLRNAELTIRQDGDVVCEVPCSEFQADHSFENETNRYIDLGGEYLLREDKPFEIMLTCPADSSTGAANEYIEVRLSGIQTSEK